MAKILIVEDNEMNRDMLSRRLIRRGYQIVIAVDGEEGIATAKAETPDLILMDMSLPVVDGWEATRRLKAEPTTRAIPVIGLTAHAMAGDREKVIDGRLRRLRYKAGRAAPAVAEDRGAARPRRRAAMSGGRLERAVAAFLRQEFGASVAAIIGFIDILIEDARRHDLDEFLSRSGADAGGGSAAFRADRESRRPLAGRRRRDRRASARAPHPAQRDQGLWRTARGGSARQTDGTRC